MKPADEEAKNEKAVERKWLCAHPPSVRMHLSLAQLLPLFKSVAIDWKGLRTK
jgi:hypothetical protein